MRPVKSEKQGIMKPHGRSIGGAIVLMSGLLTGAAVPAAETVILDESCYMRSYHQFEWDQISAQALKSGKPEDALMPKPALERLEQGVKRRLSYLKPDWSKEDWRDRAVIRFASPNAGIRDNPEDEHLMNFPPPPPNWAAADFDDSDWPRRRRPFLVGRPEVGFGIMNFGVRASYHRLRFFVPDPAACGDLSLSITYRGGVRVFLNGSEVARKNVPPGNYDVEAVADPYPAEAYVRLREEYLPKTEDRVDAYLKQGKGECPCGLILLPEMFGPMPAPGGNGLIACHRGTTSVTPETWKRIQTVRERTLDKLAIPAGKLKKGENLLAIEVRSASLHPAVSLGGAGWLDSGNFSWAHDQLTALKLTCPSGQAPSLRRRPAGVQVWSQDMHARIYDTEWADPGAPPAPIRLIGARNGTYSGQIAVGADRELKDVQAVASALTGPAGTIPAEKVEIFRMQPRPIRDLAGASGGRSKSLSDSPLGTTGFASPCDLPLRTHWLGDVEGMSYAERLQAIDKLFFCEQLSENGPREVPADKCRGIWVRVRVPPDAKAGKYTGAVKVETGGGAPVSVPMELEVADWLLPEVRQLQLLCALEQSPYGVARHYKVKLWSEEHWKLLEPSLRELGRCGNKWLFVPVISWTELGNRDDSPVKWTRKADGSFVFDYAILDRYVDMAVKHWGTPRVISFVIQHGNPANPAEVQVFDETSGRIEPLRLSGKGVTETVRRQAFGSFGVALYNHMKQRGLEKAMFYGYAWDSEGDPGLVALMNTYTPGVWWSMGGHDMRCDPYYYRAFSWIYHEGAGTSMIRSGQGWKNPKLEFQNPRGGGSVLSLPGAAPAFGFRLEIDRCLTVGCRGPGRVGADYWDDIFFDGARGGEVWCQPGMETHGLFWPGPGGAESSGRFEALVEGVQEAEARIFIEQALARGLLPADLAARAQAVVDEHIRATSFIPAGVAANGFLDYAPAGWTGRSRALYRMAAEIAARAGLDPAESSLTLDVPARGEQRAALRLRNWTGQSRAWKAQADQPWLKLEKSEGATATGEALQFILDAAALEPGKTVKGGLTVTDTDSGFKYPVAISANVSLVYALSVKELVFNPAPNQPEIQGFTLLNHSGKPLAWTAKSPGPWLLLEPASGTLAPQSILPIQATVNMAEGRAVETGAIAVAESSGVGPGASIVARAFAVPAYRPPALPLGEAVPLDRVGTNLLKRHSILAGTSLSYQNWMRTNDENKPYVKEAASFAHGVAHPADLKGFKKTYEKALWVRPHHESVYALQGSGFRAFAAEVGFPKGMEDGRLHQDARVNFEIWVDDKPAAQSGFMSVGDEPRLLAVAGLAGAKELRLVTRLASLKDSDRCLVFWADPRFYR